jgi:hypothetical protein
LTFEQRIKRLVHSVLSRESISHVAFAAQISTPTDCVSKQTVGQWLGGNKGIGWERFNRITDWLARHGHPVTVPEVEEEK